MVLYVLLHLVPPSTAPVLVDYVASRHREEEGLPQYLRAHLHRSLLAQWLVLHFPLHPHQSQPHKHL